MAKSAADQAEEVDYSPYLGKDATDMQSRFTTWLEEVVGYSPASAKTKAEAFEEGVRLATALRMEFQRSPENQEVLESRRQEIEKEKAARAAAPKKERKTRKPKQAEEAELEPDDEDDDDEEPAPAPKPAARRGRPAKAKKPEPAPDDEEDDDEEDEPEPAPAKPTRRTRKPAGSAPRTGARRSRAAKSDAAPF